MNPGQLLNWPNRRHRRAPRGPKLPVPKELAIHSAVVDVANKFLRENWSFLDPASGEHRDPRTGAKLSDMGVLRGVPDLVFMSPNGVAHLLSINRPGIGRHPDEQAVFHKRAKAHKAALAVLSLWDALRFRLSEGQP